MVQAVALRLLQPFSESLDEASVNKAEGLHRSFSRAVIGCAVAAAVSSRLSSFLPYVYRQIRRVDRDADRND